MAPTHSSRCLHGTLLTLLLLLVAAATFVSAATAREEALAARHQRWMAKFGRVYTDAAEKLHRQEVFAANARHIDAVNRAGNRTYTLGLNQFSDLTHQEFAEKHLGLRPEDSTPVAAVNMSKAQFENTPDSMDWRAQGAVTEVKNQGLCGFRKVLAPPLEDGMCRHWRMACVRAEGRCRLPPNFGPRGFPGVLLRHCLLNSKEPLVLPLIGPTAELNMDDLFHQMISQIFMCWGRR